MCLRNLIIRLNRKPKVDLRKKEPLTQRILSKLPTLSKQDWKIIAGIGVLIAISAIAIALAIASKSPYNMEWA